MFSLKVVLLLPPSIVTAVVALKLSAPAIGDIYALDLPSLCNGFGSWFFTPWYMFLVINGIIAAIFACSKLFSAQSPPPQHSPRLPPPIGSIPMYYPASDYTSVSEIPNDRDSIVKPEANFVPYEKSKNESASFHPNADSGGVPIPTVFTDDATSNKENECILVAKSSPIVNALVPTAAAPRLGHRRNLKSSPQGHKPLLGLSKPKRQQHTLEDTWKTVTEGRTSTMPLTRHLNKPEIWEKTPPKTFTDRSKVRSPSSGGSNDSAGVWRRDELNRRVEAFIRKFNEDMRLQR